MRFSGGTPLFVAGFSLVMLSSCCRFTEPAVRTHSEASLAQLIDKHDGASVDAALSAICSRVEDSEWLLSQLAMLDDVPPVLPFPRYSLETMPMEVSLIFKMLNDLAAVPVNDYAKLPGRLDSYLPLLDLARFGVNLTTMEIEISSGIGYACLILNERGRPLEQYAAAGIRHLMPSVPRASNEALYWVLVRGLNSCALEFESYGYSPEDFELLSQVSSTFLSEFDSRSDHQKWIDYLRQVRQQSSPSEEEESFIDHSIFNEKYLALLQSACGL